MDREKTDLIRNALAVVERKRRKIKNIDKLVNRKIDRKFHLDLNELTPQELDFEMGRRAASLKENADPRVWINMKAGGNKAIKVLLLPVFFLRMVFLKPVSIIRDFIFYNNAMLVRMRKTDERLSRLENRLDASIDSRAPFAGEEK